MSTAKQYIGVYTAIITPMRDGQISYEEIDSLVEQQIAAGVDGIVAVGTTGESPTVNTEEHIQIIKRVVDAAKGRVKVIAGSGANSTSEALHLTREADRAGADAFLQVTPYYNKPNQEGLFQHFSAVASVTDKPIILYSIPGRSVIEIAVETFVRLAEKHENVRIIKESGGRVYRASQIIDAMGDEAVVLSGEDEHTLPYISVGAQGVISVASNILPGLVVEMVRAALKGDLKAATATHRRLYPLFRDLFCDTSPGPIKYAMKRAGLIKSEDLRLPLTPPGPEARKKVDATLKLYGIS